LSKNTEACHFYDDNSKVQNWNYLPEEIGDACLGKASCSFSLNYNGFAYNGKNYDLRNTLASG
jgi:hypothetical protein